MNWEISSNELADLKTVIDYAARSVENAERSLDASNCFEVPAHIMTESQLNRLQEAVSRVSVKFKG
jgi:hypothetical protein